MVGDSVYSFGETWGDSKVTLGRPGEIWGVLWETLGRPGEALSRPFLDLKRLCCDQGIAWGDLRKP